MEHALGQTRYPLWVFTKEECEDWENAFTANEWDHYNFHHPDELEDYTPDEWNEYLEGRTPQELEAWAARWSTSEWHYYLEGPIDDRRTEYERNLERGWYQATVAKKWYATATSPAPPPPLVHLRPIPDDGPFDDNTPTVGAALALHNNLFAEIARRQEQDNTYAEHFPPTEADTPTEKK